MGNVIAGGERRKVRLMKVDGETMKLKGPVSVGEVVRQYPNHAVLDSRAVKNLGTMAKPLDEDHELKGGKKHLYFLVEVQKLQPPPQPQQDERLPRRARSTGIHMTAKERLDSLMLAKRSVSDLTFVKAPVGAGQDSAEDGGGVLRVKMRVPKSQVTQLLQGSTSGADVTQKIINLCLKNDDDSAAHAAAGNAVAEGSNSGNLGTRKPALGSIQEGEEGAKSALRQKKGVRFQTTEEGEVA